MVADDLGGSSQGEDPLPCRSDKAASLSTDHSIVQSPPPDRAAHRSGPHSASLMSDSSRAADDTAAGRVPIWDRLPRSIWLMGQLALLNASLMNDALLEATL